MSISFGREYDRFTLMTMTFVLLAVVLFSGSALADTFVFDATTSPITGQYIPLGAGHYYGTRGFESFSAFNALIGFGIEGSSLFFSQGDFPADSSSSCDHNTGIPGTCFNGADFFLAGDGSLLGRSFGLPMTVAIYSTNDRLLAFIELSCSEDVLCYMNFFTGLHGSPIDVAALPGGLGQELLNAPKIVATRGIQDAIDAHFYDGSVDSFEVVLTTPEPSSVFLLAIPVIGFAFRRRFHSFLKASGSR